MLARSGEGAAVMGTLESILVEGIGAVGIGIDAFGVLIIVAGIGRATVHFIRRRLAEGDVGAYKVRVGRSLLLGLEVLVAADIVKTIALEPTYLSLGVLAGLIVVRTFLGWTLVLEIEGRWPWQPQAGAGERAADRPAGAMAAMPARSSGHAPRPATAAE
jgi:uncharacterized membrane protein